MPNPEKETDPSSLAAQGAELRGSDFAKLVGQRLESLRRAGLTHLPKGTGAYAFEPIPTAQSETDSDSIAKPSGQATKVVQRGIQSETNTEAVQSSEVIKESKPQFQTATRLVQEPAANASSNPGGSTPPTACAETQTGSPTGNGFASDSYGQSLPPGDRASALKVLQEQVARCTQCDELASTRSQTVFGVGSPATRLVFLGEGPGADEDRLGEPFVGAAGQLLDKIISACNLSRSDVYILNTVKCRPPGNRNPSQGELANCWGFAEQQLEFIQPEFICCLGSVAARTLLKTTLSIGKLRRQLHDYRGSRVLVTYHPAYLLRTPSAKKHVWEDMKFLMKTMGIELPN